MSGVLGKKVAAPKTYSPDILEAIPRAAARERRGIAGEEGQGADVWHLYELSWLDDEGRPEAFCGALTIPASSPATVESKSLKLYLNSLNFHCFSSTGAAKACIEKDIGSICGAAVSLTLITPNMLNQWTRAPRGICIDDNDPRDALNPETAISVTREFINETVHSHLLRSLCPVTGQPDWAVLEVKYTGALIDRPWLLNLVLSYREHQDFHEQCIEQIFAQISREWLPRELTVRGFYLRRGGIDITPHRSLQMAPVAVDRLPHQ